MGASYLSTPTPGTSNLCLKQRTEQQKLKLRNRQGVEQNTAEKQQLQTE